MTPEEVVATVFGADPAEVDDTTSPVTLTTWDSVGHVTLVLELESTYGVALSAEDAVAMSDVGAIKRVLIRHGAAW